MNKLRREVAFRAAKMLDAMLVTLPFALCWYLYYAQKVSSPYYRKGNWAVIGLFLLLYILFSKLYEGFLVSINRISEIVYSQCLAYLVSDGILYIVICLLSKRMPNPMPGIAAIGGQFMAAVLWAYLAHRWYFHTFPPQATAVIYERRENLSQLINEYGLNKKFLVRSVLLAEECVNDLHQLDGISAVFLSDISSHERNLIIKHCVANDIDVFVIPNIGDTLMSAAHPMHMFHLPMLRLGRYMASPEYLFLKRAFDILLSAFALILLSPVMLVIAIIIKTTDGGPVFYKQIRLTKDGRPFRIIKFRSMRVDAEQDGVARLSTGAKDERITPIGCFIRKYRLDEVPQFLNILRGDMSLVGPRAERPEIAAQYEQALPEFALRLQVKAGLTGYAQVYGKYNTTPYNKLQMDLMYIAHPSLIKDMKIIFATIKILFLPESTEGIAEGQITAEENDEREGAAI